ncbi:hypothetical protein ACFSTC_29360 [Nonomuraea ferruginea]
MAPSRNITRHSQPNPGANAGSTSAAQLSGSSTRSTVRAPKWWANRPVVGIVRNAPTGGQSRASPSMAGSRPRLSWIHGVRVTRLPVTAPCKAKAAAMAR